MASLETDGVNMPEIRKSYWWSKCVAAAQLRPEVTESVCVTASQARLCVWIIETTLAISKQMSFVGLIFSGSAVPLM
ncbi:hypothetical protein ACSBR1_007937 [Camellia fascicularis]